MKNRIELYILEKLKGISVKSKSELNQIARDVKKKFNTECKCLNADGFVSLGYELECFVIAYLDECGKIQGVPVKIEKTKVL